MAKTLIYDEPVKQKTLVYDDAQAEPSAISRLMEGKLLPKREQEINDIENAYRRGDIGINIRNTQLLGKGPFGLVQDVSGELLSKLTPDFVKTGAKNAVSAAGSIPAYDMLGNKTTLGGLAQSIPDSYSGIKKEYPNATRTVESVTNIAGTLLPFVPVGAGTSAASAVGNVVEKPLRKTASVIGNTAAAPFNRIANVVSQKSAKRAFEQMAQDGVGLTDITDKALGKVLTRLQSDFPDEQSFMQALETYAKGNKALIENAGDRTINLAKGAAQYPSGEAISKEFIQGKLQNTPERIKASLSNAVSDKVDYYKTAESISKVGQAKAAPLYEQAFNSAPVISERVNQFVNTPELQAGINRGLKIQRLEALRDNVKFDPKQYGITQFNEAGDPIISGVPNMRLLDAGKRGLDAMIEENTDQFGKLNELGRALVGVKQSYLSELDNINPAYKEARKVAGDYLSNVNAMRQGKDFSKLDSATVKNVFEKMDAGQRESFKVGVVKSIRDKIDNAPDNANIYKQVFGRSEQRNRIKSILGEKEFNKLSSDLASEEKLYKLRDEVLGGSPTASKQVASQEFNDEMVDLASSVVKTGATKALLDKGTSVILRSFSGLSNKTAEQVAKALYETDPIKKRQIMEKLRFMAKKDEVKPAFQAFFGVNNKIKQKVEGK